MGRGNTPFAVCCFPRGFPGHRLTEPGRFAGTVAPRLRESGQLLLRLRCSFLRACASAELAALTPPPKSPWPLAGKCPVPLLGCTRPGPGSLSGQTPGIVRAYPDPARARQISLAPPACWHSGTANHYGARSCAPVWFALLHRDQLQGAVIFISQGQHRHPLRRTPGAGENENNAPCSQSLSGLSRWLLGCSPAPKASQPPCQPFAHPSCQRPASQVQKSGARGREGKRMILWTPLPLSARVLRPHGPSFRPQAAHSRSQTSRRSCWLLSTLNNQPSTILPVIQLAAPFAPPPIPNARPPSIPKGVCASQTPLLARASLCANAPFPLDKMMVV
jgi:hypothetical protein